MRRRGRRATQMGVCTAPNCGPKYTGARCRVPGGAVPESDSRSGTCADAVEPRGDDAHVHRLDRLLVGAVAVLLLVRRAESARAAPAAASPRGGNGSVSSELAPA